MWVRAPPALPLNLKWKKWEKMDKTNSKILTLVFAMFAALVGFTLHLLLKSFAAAFAVIARMTDSDVVRHGVPIVVGFLIFGLLQFNPKVLAWAEEVVQEIRKVVWPSNKDTTAMTIVVVIMVFISSVIVTSFDFVSGYVLNMVVK